MKKYVYKCPHCKHELNVGALLRKKPATWKQRQAARLNGQRGGRPKDSQNSYPVGTKPKFLYKIMCPVTDKVVYVGVSGKPLQRMSGHRRPFSKSTTRVSEWVKLLWDTHSIGPIITSSKKSYPTPEAFHREARMIKFYQSIGQCSLNSPEKRHPNEPAQCDDTSF
jgi:hypothetical protein